MTRSPNPRLVRSPVSAASSSRGLADRRLWLAAGGGAFVLLLAWLLFLPPLSLLRGGDSGWTAAGADDLIRRRDEVPKLPDGYELASPLYEVRSKVERGTGAATVTLPLDGANGGRGLTMYTYSAAGGWKRLAAAELVSDGRAARARIDNLPETLAVLRRTAGALSVTGILPSATPLHPDGEKLVTARAVADFDPLPDGSLAGDLTPPQAADVISPVSLLRAVAGENAAAVNALLQEEATRQAHVAAILKLAQLSKAEGIELEYTAVEPRLGGNFSVLVASLAAELRKGGQTLTVALPLPKRDGANWNTLGYDWKELAKHADALRLVPERDQSKYRANLRDALNYLTVNQKIDARKLILTISPLAVDRSDSDVKTLTALQGLSVAAQFSVQNRDQIFTNSDVALRTDNLGKNPSSVSGLIWDANAASVSFIYQAGETQRTIWIENVYSAAFKLEFVKLWGLGGVTVDYAGDEKGTANIWPAVAQLLRDQLALVQPNGGLLQTQWLVDGQSREVGKGEFIWKPGAAGNHTVTLVVSDGVLRVSKDAQLTVRPGNAPVPPTPTRTPTPAR